MIDQTKAKIFLADERGLNESPWFRRHSTFNFEDYFNEHKYPPGNVYVLNDETLDGGRSMTMSVRERSYVVLVPAVGVISYSDHSDYTSLVAAGQSLIAQCDEGTEFKITNPFPHAVVNYLQIWIKADANEAIETLVSTYENVNENLNTIVPLHWDAKKLSPGFYDISIGKFSGRGETIYKKKPSPQIFVYVLQGAFEVQGRLLHARDGLVLWNSEHVEMEALSNDAVILVFEEHFSQRVIDR